VFLIDYIAYFISPFNCNSINISKQKPRRQTKQQEEPKDAKTELTAELKQKVVADRTMKQKKAKGFRGLQPQERPIHLPGGRKWRNEKDAMNEEMIAEIISSQAELIMGTTLGYVCYQTKELFICIISLHSSHCIIIIIYSFIHASILTEVLTMKVHF